MATLYVENVPEELYESLRERAKQHHRSIAAEVLTMLESHLPSNAELARRKEILQFAAKARGVAAGVPGAGAEEMLREDRER